MGNKKKEKAVAPVYNSEYLVVQANELIRAKQDELTLLEAKLIRFAISQILQEDKDFKTFRIETVKLAKFLNMPKGNIYREIDKLTDSIMKKVIKIYGNRTEDEEPEYKKFHWVDMAEYKTGVITLKLSDELKPYLLGLNELFTQFPYSDILELPTYNAMRLFELLSSYQNIRFRERTRSGARNIPTAEDEVIFSIEQLREYFQCENKYKQPADFISRVIDNSINAINERTVLRVNYRTIKAEKGKITHIVFKIGDVASQIEESVEV